MAIKKSSKTEVESTTNKNKNKNTNKTKKANEAKKDCEKCVDKTCVDKQPEKLTTTKKVLWLSWILFVVLIVLEILGYSLDVAIEIIGGIMTTIITSVYLWKSRLENKMKISMSIINDLADKYGIENVTPIISQIIND